MKLYRTTKYYGDRVWFTRFSTKKMQFAAVKGAIRWAYVPWHVGGGMPRQDTRVRVTLEMIEVPDDAWVMVEDTGLVDTGT